MAVFVSVLLALWLQVKCWKNGVNQHGNSEDGNDVPEQGVKSLERVAGIFCHVAVDATLLIWPFFEPMASRSSFANDLRNGPDVGLRSLTYLILGDGLIPRNEDSALFRLGSCHRDGGYSQQQQATAGQNPSSIHRCTPLPHFSETSMGWFAVPSGCSHSQSMGPTTRVVPRGLD